MVYQINNQKSRKNRFRNIKKLKEAQRIYGIIFKGIDTYQFQSFIGMYYILNPGKTFKDFLNTLIEIFYHDYNLYLNVRDEVCNKNKY